MFKAGDIGSRRRITKSLRRVTPLQVFYKKKGDIKMIEIIGDDGMMELKVSIEENFWVSKCEYEEFKEKLKELIEESRL